MARGLNFGLSLYLQPYFLYACLSSKGSPESSLFDNALSTKICAGPIVLCTFVKVHNFQNPEL